MQDDEELKNQCWGGEYLSEVRVDSLNRSSKNQFSNLQSDVRLKSVFQF